MPYDEKETEEYIENLGIEYRFSCFHERDPEGCHLLGEYMEQVKRDYVAAAQLFKDSCEEFRFGHSCQKFASYCYKGRGGVQRDADRAANYFQKGCIFGNAEACMNAGQLFAGFETAISKNFKISIFKAMYFLDKACKGDIADACRNASIIAYRGRHGYPVDEKKALAFARKACHLNNGPSCKDVSLMYEKGIGTEKNAKLAKRYYDKFIDIRDQYERGQVIETQRT